MEVNAGYAFALLRMVIKSATSQRRALLFRAIFSMTAHLAYLPVWLVMFSYVPTIKGWGIGHAFYAYGISIAAWGIVSLVAHGLRTLPQQIDNGELDVYLTLPQPVLLSVALGTSKSSGLGETFFGIGLCVFTALHYGMSLALAPFFILNACIVFASGVLFFASFGFWVRQFFASAEEIYFNFSLMASRPAPIFTGLLQLITITVIPFGLIAHMPVRFLEGRDPLVLALTFTATILYAIVSISFFNAGLRHYESGNRFGVRG